MLGEGELDRLTEACRALPPAKGNYLEQDFVRNLLLTVLDFQMQGRVVEKAIKHFNEERWNSIRTFEDVEGFLALYPDDKEGNTRAAQWLWSNNHWTRMELLRRLVTFFKSVGVIDQPSLRAWAAGSDYKRDFEGKVKGMAYAIYNWLVMRQGIETVKPDVHVQRFVASVLNRRMTENELVAGLQTVARRLSIKAYELDWRIWEFQRGLGPDTWTGTPASEKL